MTLSPNALVSLSTALSQLSVPADDSDVLIGQLNRASEMIAKICNRKFRRAIRYVHLDSLDDRMVYLKEKPIWNVFQVWVDTLRVFGTDTLVTGWTIAGDYIDIGTTHGYGDSIIKIEYESGFDLADYDQENDPFDVAIDPHVTPILGTIWLSSAGIKRFDGTLIVPTGEWIDYDTELVPGNVTQATLEYISFIRRKIKPGESGLAKRDNAGTGGTVTYETTIPSHVLSLLASEVSYA